MNLKTRKTIGIVVGSFAFLSVISAVTAPKPKTESIGSNWSKSTTSTIEGEKPEPIEEKKTYVVVNVVDGDTIDVDMDGKTQRIRLIGVNTPETVHPEKTVEYFGKEASEYTKKHLSGKSVVIETDDSQDRFDKYGRMLAYVFVDGKNFNKSLIEDGYAYEYTYNVPYKYQSEFKKAQKNAESNNKGLWAPKEKEKESTVAEVKKPEEKKPEPKKTNTAKPKTNTTTKKTNNTTKNNTSNNTKSTSTAPKANCNIKGNINGKEKIYHVPGGASYNKTKIDTSKGERWFCSEAEAQKAGWRKAKK